MKEIEMGEIDFTFNHMYEKFREMEKKTSEKNIKRKTRYDFSYMWKP